MSESPLTWAFDVRCRSLRLPRRSMFIAFQEDYVLDIKLRFIEIAVFLAPFEGASSYHVLWAWLVIWCFVNGIRIFAAGFICKSTHRSWTRHDLFPL